jgi:hypothetical protein
MGNRAVLAVLLLLTPVSWAQSAPAEMVWARQFGNVNTNNAAAVLYNESVGVVVAGFTRQGTGPTGLADDKGFSEMFSGVDGAIFQREEFASAGIDHAAGIATGRCPLTPTKCGFYVVGDTTGLMQGANPPRAGTGTKSDIFVVEFNHMGNLTTPTRQLGSLETDQVHGVVRVPPALGATLASIVVVGDTRGDLRKIAIVPSQGAATGSGDAFAMLLTDGSTKPEWVFQFGDPASLDAAEAVAVDAQRRTYVVGYTYGSLGLGCSKKGGKDGFVVQIDAVGRQRWCDQIGSVGANSQTEALGVAYADPCDSLFVVGSTMAALGQGKDAFISRYTSSGVLLWTKQDWLGLAGDSVARDRKSVV